jgi:hypothetical protein
MLNDFITMRAALTDYNVFSQYYLNLIPNPDQRLFKLNSVTAYWLKNKQLSNIENWDQTTIHSLTDEQVNEGSQFISDLNLPLDYKIYPASRTSFFREFFKVSPVLANAIYSAMNDQGLIMGVGAGRGYATLFKHPASLTEDYYKQFIVSHNSDVYRYAVNELSLTRKPASITSALNHAVLTQEEIQYYFSYMAAQQAVIEELNDKVLTLQKQNYINTQLTWR